MKRITNSLATAALVALVSVLTALPAAAVDPATLAFTVEISGSGDDPIITFTNNSPQASFSRVDLQIRDNRGFFFDGDESSLDGDPADPATASLVNNDPPTYPPVDSTSMVVLMSDFGPGNSFSAKLDMDKNRPDGTLETTSTNFRTVFFGNGNQPNARIVVQSGARSVTLTLPETPPNEGGVFTFRGPNRKLSIFSQTDTAERDEVIQVVVRRDGVLIDPVTGEPDSSADEDEVKMGNRADINVAHGDEIEIVAPRQVFKNIHGVDITDLINEEPQKINEDAEERFTAIGISVNNLAQTGDPTLFRFEITEDTEVELKWQHEYALTVDHDFSATASIETDAAGNPFAGPLDSKAVGDPDPEVQKHWIKRGTNQIAQIDGSVLDFNRPGFDIRYVPIGYISYGPPNTNTEVGDDDDRFTANGEIDIREVRGGDIDSYADPGGGETTINTDVDHGFGAGTKEDVVFISGSSAPELNGEHVVTVTGPSSFTIAVAFPGTPPTGGKWEDITYRRQTDFIVGQAPGRQQVDQFTMYGPAGITYVWQIQYGVRVNVDDPTRGVLPEIFSGNPRGTLTSVGDGEGVFWFDPGTSLTVASEKTEGGSDPRDLNGWLNGDSFYFSGTADIDADGSFVNGGIGSGNKSLWNGGFDDPATNTRYLGMEIPDLQRPVRVLWRYGDAALAVRVAIGQYIFQDDPVNAARFLQEPALITQQAVTGLNQNVGSAEMAVWDPVAAKLFPLVPGQFKADWPDTSGQTVGVIVTAEYPFPAHYPHLVGAPPVALDPDPNDNFIFKELKYTEGGQTAVDNEKRFTAGEAGKSVLLFSELQPAGRGGPREFVRVRVVDSRDPGAERGGSRDPGAERGARPATEAVIGSKITDPELDLARLGTGYLLNTDGDVRYNPFVYDPSLLETLTANAVYDLDALHSTQGRKEVINPSALPGPVIPVNLHPGADQATQRLAIGWYDDPAENDGLLWPHASRLYLPRWPERDRSEVTLFSEVAKWPAGATLPDERLSIAVTGELGLVASSRDDSVTILDIGDPTQPTQLSQVVDSAGGFQHLRAVVDVAASGDLAVVASSTEGLTLMDISDPLNPTVFAELGDGEGGADYLMGISSVALSGNHLFVTSQGEDALTIIDVSDPAQPEVLSQTTGGPWKFAGLADVAVSGDTAYVVANGDHALTMIDISDPRLPMLLADLTDGDGSVSLLRGAQSVAVEDNVVYVAAADDSAVTAIDVSDPGQPMLLSESGDGGGIFDSLGGASSVAVAGHLVYVAAPNDNALVVIDMSAPTSPVKVREILDGGPEGLTKLNGADSVVLSAGLAFVTSTAEGALTALQVRPDRLGRIVIASQFGSESIDRLGNDQLVVPALNGLPAETTYNPSRLQQVVVYNQPDQFSPGYNPNEEHALLAGSLRFSSVSPRPPSAYALRAGDLNVPETLANLAESSQSPTTYTSHPFVLVSFFDTADSEFKMNVYEILPEVPRTERTAPRDYRFAGGVTPQTPILTLATKPRVTMEAGEPVIPFYPLGVAIGASPCAETYGNNLKGQIVFWEDHKNTSWSISGGENAWFTAHFFYPLAPDFFWPEGTVTPPIRTVKQPDGTVRAEFDNPRTSFVPRVGDCVAFLPQDVDAGGSAGNVPSHLPIQILYKSEWPALAPVLKAGETLTFQGGEFRADNPTMFVRNLQGELVRENTPGLPGVVGFATAEVVFDSLNPRQTSTGWKSQWTARVIQALDVRQVDLPIDDFPGALQPSTGRTSVKGGKYVFNDLPASLQKRFRYDPTGQKFEFIGFLNDKDIGEPTLTAAPPAVYVLEPNILTAAERNTIKDLVESGDDKKTAWDAGINALYELTRNPGVGRTVNGEGRITSSDVARNNTNGSYGNSIINGQYLVGLEGKIEVLGDGTVVQDNVGGVNQPRRFDNQAVPMVAFGPGLAIVPNGDFLDPAKNLPDTSWITVVENNHPSLGGSPVTPHVIKVRKGVDELGRTLRYRGSIKTILSDNVFDENINLQHTGEFGTNTNELVFDWWYRPDDGSLNVPPPDLIPAGQPNPWKLFPDPSGNRGRARFNVQLKGNPNAPEALLADTFWFVRYRHVNELPEDDITWDPHKQALSAGEVLVDERIDFTWAGAGNSQPFEDFDGNGIPDFRAQLAQGWIKRVLDAVNPYEARIRDFEGENPSTVVSMLRQLGPGFEGPVALNPAKNVIENVGLIELYRTVLERGKSLSIDLSRPVSTPAISNALQLASTRLADFYTLLGNEAYGDALDQTIGFGSDSVEYGSLAPAVHAFQNQMGSLLEEELALLRGVDDFFARPVYNRLFWNLTKGEGEAAYALNYNLSDVNMDGFIDEDDAMIMYPQGHGDAWGHYLNALRHTYELLNEPNFNWVSRSEFYNLQDIVIKVDFLDERKFAATAAAKAKAGKEIVDNTYRQNYVEDSTAQWQGYTDTNDDRGWGVQGWARRAGQGAYFDWITANALLPSQHPNEELEGIQKVDRSTNGDIKVISANLNSIQRTFDEANSGYNPLNIASGDTVPFDIDPEALDGSAAQSGVTHFEQIYARAVDALKAATAIWDNANQSRNLLRKIGNSEEQFRNKTFQENLAYRNRLIKIFGRPYEGTIGPGNLYPAGYNGPDVTLFMYVDVNQINRATVPGPVPAFAAFDSAGNLIDTPVQPDGSNPTGDIYDAFVNGAGGNSISNLSSINNNIRTLFSPTFAGGISARDFGIFGNVEQGSFAQYKADAGLFAVNYTDLVSPKIPLDNFTQLMPTTAAGYSFLAPDAWGDRLAVGELQTLINKMIQQEAQIARSIGAWDGLSGAIAREMRLINSRLLKSDIEQGIKIGFGVTKSIVNNVIKGIEGGRDIADLAKKVVIDLSDAGEKALPDNLPTGGLAVSPGDALAPAAAAILFGGAATKSALEGTDKALKIAKLVAEIGFDVADTAVELGLDAQERTQNKREWVANLENMAGDEPIVRIEIFRQIQILKEMSDRYRALLDEGARLLDERDAFNKRVAAAVQRNRYQDMTFRVTRSHSLQTYRDSFDVAARYAYLAGKAYEYETNLPANHPGAVQPLLSNIVRTRGLGYLSGGNPAIGKGGISEQLATMKTNYDTLKGQLGFNNPQEETGKMSLRTEMMRIFPSGQQQPVAGPFPSPGAQADELWSQALRDAVVEDLWDESVFRNYCRPFAPEGGTGGVHVKQPGIVLSFKTDITAGNNFFGWPLSGGDHAYDPSNFTTKVRSVGVWFAGYKSDDIQDDLSEAPRIYLIPAGSDIMSYPTAGDPSTVRMWNVVDQRIPVPLPVNSADLDFINYIPLIDGLNDRFGDPRRFSSFRAYHDPGDPVNPDELTFDSRLVGRSVWNDEWYLIIPGLTLNADPEEGLRRFIEQVTDIRLVFQTYGHSGN